MTCARLTLPCLMAFGLLLAGCSVTRATGDRQFTAFMSPAQEARIGAAQHPKLVSRFGGLFTDAALTAYVGHIGRKLAAVTETPGARFSFHVLDSPIVNAFALPGGYVYVSRGLVALASDEAELAGVIAHEIGHVTARHAAERYSRAVAGNVLSTGLGIALETAIGQRGARTLLGNAAGLYLRGYSRDQEFQADRLSIRYLTLAGYDPKAVGRFLTKLRAHSRLQARIAGRPEDKVDQTDITATHPRTLDRVRRAERDAGVVADGTVFTGADVYLNAIDGLPFGKRDAQDQGMIAGSRFLHGSLGFAFDAPLGFRLQNSPERVTATGPHDTRMIFQAVKPKPDQALDAYLDLDFSDQIALRRIAPLTINGLPAAQGRALITQNGVPTRLWAVIVRLAENQTYLMMYLSPDSRGARYDGAFMDSAFSFRPLSADEVPEAGQTHIKIVNTGGRQQQNGFVEKMAVTGEFSAQWFRVLNGLEGNEALGDRHRVKIVR